MTVNKIKILFIHHAEGWGGSPLSMLNTIMALDKSKYLFEVLLLHDSIVSKILKENGISVKVAKSFFYKRFYDNYVHSVAHDKTWFRIDREAKSILSWLLNRYFFATKELQGFDYDIVHLNSSTLTDWLAPCKAKGKVVMHIREPFSKGNFGIRHKLLTSQMRKYADCIIAISNDNANRINVPEKTRVIYNFVNIKEENEIDKCKPESGKVLYFGGSEKIKGYFTVVDSLDYLDYGIKIIFCGNYSAVDNKSGIVGSLKSMVRSVLPFHKKLRAALIKIKNHPNAVFVGLVNNSTQMIQESELLISPFSNPHFARPVIEAHLQKKPVIGSDVVGMDEIMEHEKTGLIVPKNNPKALAAAINELIANKQKAKMLGEAGYNIAMQNYTQNNIKEFESVYDKIL